MFPSPKGIQFQFTVTIPAIEPQELQFDPNPKSGVDRIMDHAIFNKASK